VVMVDALHHVSNQCLTVNELWRVLAPGGRIVIIEPDIDKPVTKLIALIEKILMMRSHFLSGEKIRALFIDPDASVHLFNEGFNVILIAEK
jgi:ubiquinone/menaquinone biosynthesis C-methylase UbiE